MELRNKLSLEIDEAILILQNLASSLAKNKKFELHLDNQDVSLDVGSKLSATLIFSNTRFSLDFQWDEEQIITSKTPPAVQAMPSSTPQSTPKPQAIVQTSSEMLATLEGLRAEGLKPRKFQTQMVLETTTLPYDGGVWSPAFTLTETPLWTPMDINNQLENSKWISDEELEALTGENIPRKPRAKMPGVSRKEDDMFSSLDQEESRTSKQAISTKPVAKAAQRQVVTPAGMVNYKSIPKTSFSQSDIDEAAATWSEPSAENNVSGDEWVKPSEVIQKKRNEPVGQRDPHSPPKSKKEAQIRTWSEPTSEDNSTDDEWVKPSEILRRKNEGVQKAVEKTANKQEVISKKNRPPPKAPDEKEEGKKKKGWAKW